MPCDVVLGGQWGDEGKGKIVDYLSTAAHAVVRVQGGANAGHTLVIDGRKLALHLVPSGVSHPECLMVLGCGMVIDPLALLEEIAVLESSGLEIRGRIRLSTAAHVVLPCHRLQDRAEEQRRGAGSVGTTGRGIGPAYADKAARVGLQLGAFLQPEAQVRARIESVLRAKQRALGSEIAFDVGEMTALLVGCREQLVPLLCDTTALLHDLCAAGRRIILEGAQGVLLDLDHGSYPYVTSSSCTTAGALAGSGLPAQEVASVTGVLKAYATRVGNGPFPTELTAGEGERLRRVGDEFGATTGRPRRCGWFDSVAARYAARLCGFTQIALTKLDVLDDFDTLCVADWYELDGARLERWPVDADTLARCTPGYLELEGWRRATRGCRTIRDLPENARRYIQTLQERVGVPVGLVSVGPERDSTFRI